MLVVADFSSTPWEEPSAAPPKKKHHFFGGVGAEQWTLNIIWLFQWKGWGDLHHFGGMWKEHPWDYRSFCPWYLLTMVSAPNWGCSVPGKATCSAADESIATDTSTWKQRPGGCHHPTPSRLCELEIALLTRMLQKESDFNREQTRTDGSFCGFVWEYRCRKG